MPRVNVRETNANMSALTGRDLPPGTLPDNAKVTYNKIYNGRKGTIGSAAIVLALDMRKAVVCMCLQFNPPQMGKEAMTVLNNNAEKNGEPVSTKDRWIGIDWIGIDEANLCKKTTFLKKFGWFATPDTTRGGNGMMGLVRKMSYEIMNAHMAIDFYLAELLVPDGAMETTKVILDVLMRKTTIDTTPEDELPEAPAAESESPLFD